MRSIHTAPLLAAVCMLLGLECPGAVPNSEISMEELRQGFAHPPDSVRPWVYWFWMDGNITKEGITADLEAMQRVGIGGMILFDVAHNIPGGPVRFGSPEWYQLFKHAVSEATRLGLQLNMHNSPGWTGSGGPWITPDLAMQEAVSSRTNISGPGQFNGTLPRVAGEESSHTIAILAFPALVGEGATPTNFSPKITASDGAGSNWSNLMDGNRRTFVSLRAPGRKPQYLQLEFAQPYAASMLKFEGTSQRQSFAGTFQVSDNGHTFRNVREFRSVNSGISMQFEPLSARYFRLLFTQADPGVSQLQFSELELTPLYFIDLYRSKSGLGPLPPGKADLVKLPAIPAQGIIATNSIVDLTSNLDHTGRLIWQVPTGHWTIVRLAYAPVGTMNRPARPDGVGLESDKLNPKATETHFAAFLGKLIAENQEAAGHAFWGAHIDSWELGYQNWTPHFEEQFRKKRGYEMFPFLPVLSGRYVGTPEESERFLWDMRKTIAELFPAHYAGHLATLLHQHGMQLSVQGYGSQGSGPFDELTYSASADVPSAEFWLGTDTLKSFDLHAVPSAAHTTGKKIVTAESFTSAPEYSSWKEHPFMVKPDADAAFCEGINQLIIHRYAHQPWLDRKPGMTMGPWGLHYERTQTWWEYSKPWHEYLSRCQFLLQQGAFVADLCYLTTENSYTRALTKARLEPPLSAGYNYDVAAPATVAHMSVRDGRIVLPDGMSYRALVLANQNRMTPTLLQQVKKLVESGATIIGPRPVKSPSLSDFPQCDKDVVKIADEIWGPCDGKAVKEHRYGKGQIIWGKPLDEVLAELKAAPDFQAFGGDKSALPLKWIHRRLSGSDIYFVANSNPFGVSMECRFREGGGQPEIWHADDGHCERPAIWRRDGASTVIPLRFGPAGSLFVVFPKDADASDSIVAITRDGARDTTAQVTFDTAGKLQLFAGKPGAYQVRTVSGKSYSAEIKGLPNAIPIGGKWTLNFPPNSGAPPSVTLENLISWSAHPDPGVKYFSGTATYTKAIQLPQNLFGSERKIFLNLGKVEVIAEVKLNGRDCGILWKPPFQSDITAAARPGENDLEIKVVNLWPNRLIGDEQLPADCKWEGPSDLDSHLAEWPRWLLEGKPSPTGRLTFATWKHWSKNSPLLESGLLGPVSVQVAEQRHLE